jgi:hypothetical protein
MNIKNTDKAVYVVLDAHGNGLAVEGLSSSTVVGTNLPTAALYSAHAVYDATNDRVLKWRNPEDLPVESMLPTMQLLAANPKGQFIRGRSALAAGLVAAFTGKKIDEDTDVIVWRRVAVVDTERGVMFPPRHVLQDVIVHPEDEHLLVAAALSTKGAAA